MTIANDIANDIVNDIANDIANECIANINIHCKYTLQIYIANIHCKYTLYIANDIEIANDILQMTLQIYRPPSNNIVNFLEKLEKELDKISRENKHIYIMGYFNIDLSQSLQSLSPHSNPRLIGNHSIDNYAIYIFEYIIFIRFLP